MSEVVRWSCASLVEWVLAGEGLLHALPREGASPSCLVAMYIAIRLRLGYPHPPSLAFCRLRFCLAFWGRSCLLFSEDLGGLPCPKIKEHHKGKTVRCKRPAKRQKDKLCETKAPFVFSPLLPVGSQESVLKVPKWGQFHAAGHVVLRRNFCNAESQAKCCGETCH